jgi:UDP-glucose:tetrahydrobiopterin glucosyltransferase
MRILCLSTPIGYLGSGQGGGVELTLSNVAQALQQLGHRITIVAPEGSQAEGLEILTVSGVAPASAQHQGRQSPVMVTAQDVLARMWDLACEIQGNYDLLLNFAYDWLPFYLTPFLQRPVAHLVSMGSLSDVMDEAIAQVLQRFPGTIGVHSQAQADTFAFGAGCRCLGNGLNLSHYHFNPHPGSALGWVGRIAPEKGLEDAIVAAQQVGMPLKIWGCLEKPDYWQALIQRYPDAPVSYEGFLSTQALQQALGHCRGLLVTPRWVEAFGNVAMEALACGVPVIAYRRGGPAEIVQDGKTGWLVEPDSVAGLVAAIERLAEIDRKACRHHAEQDYSLEALGDRFERWLTSVVTIPLRYTSHV